MKRSSSRLQPEKPKEYLRRTRKDEKETRGHNHHTWISNQINQKKAHTHIHTYTQERERLNRGKR